MRKDELVDELRKEKLDHRFYTYGGFYSGTYVLEEDRGVWFVFVRERNERLNEKVFEKEEDACEYIFKKIKSEHERSLAAKRIRKNYD